MRVYISGSISKDKDYYEKFLKKEEELRNMGFDVVNPARVMRAFPEEITSYADYMVNSIRLLDKCETIYMMRNWESSVGARMEYLFAQATDKNIIYESEKSNVSK